ncbi:hypothetical protein KC614_04025 [candidate division WWE3 bacterium]|uniref:Uncharacterized protein n=1 Tax=candidate division WWE3 bacterium TaxID=2053526 RepID=A0A955LKC4_UNCKA|nr:hypothetical protein [candidate division WWE3 bacterium]
MRPIETYKNQGFLLLEEDTTVELDDYETLKGYFDGYGKVVFTLMMRYFELPTWPTLIFFDLTPELEPVLNKFLERAGSFFIRTDSYKNLVDNQGIPVCPKDEVVDAIKKMKEHRERYILVLAPPTIEDQTYKSIGNCRAGYLQGEEVQEWTGPGFAEYHLAKDRFPRKATVHAYLRRVKNGHVEKLFLVGRKQFIQDLDQLRFEIGADKKGMRKMFMDEDVFKSLLGRSFIGKEPTNDELEEAYKIWLQKESEERGLKKEEIEREFVEIGERVHASVRGEFPLADFLESKEEYWEPPKKYVNLVTKHLELFRERCEKLGIDPNEKLLTMTFTKGITSEDVVFWDIHNLITDS